MSQIDKITPVTSVYAYQGDLYCEGCGREIITRLKRAVVDDGDSNNFPQGPFDNGGGESDSASFCSGGRLCVNAVELSTHKIGCPLGNPLTSDGAAALAESIRSNIASPSLQNRLIGRLLTQVWKEYADPNNTFSWLPPKYIGSLGEKLPPSLRARLKQYITSTPEQAASVHSEMYCDSQSIYLFATRGQGRRHGYRWGSGVDLLQAPANNDGMFDKIQVVSIPPAVAINHPIEDLIRDAVSEGAWD